jgi:hypothetical protein
LGKSSVLWTNLMEKTKWFCRFSSCPRYSESYGVGFLLFMQFCSSLSKGSWVFVCECRMENRFLAIDLSLGVACLLHLRISAAILSTC